MKLDSIKDHWTNSTTYFWRDSHGKVSSPYMDSEDEANEWQRQNLLDGPVLDSTGQRVAEWTAR